MQINKERFLALTAALAVGAMGTIVGCSSDDNKSSTTGGTGGASEDGGGTGGKGSATGGKGGAADKDGGAGGVVGKGGTDGGSTTDGSVTDATTDGGGNVGPCFGDTAPAVDAGGEGISPCELLYAECPIPDAGGESFTVPTYNACYTFEGYLRAGVQEAFRLCLAKIADPCGATADDAIGDCFEATLTNSCERPKPDGAVDPCVKIASGCADVTLAECQAILRSFTDDVVDLGILPCLETLGPLDAGACGDAFFACVPPNLEF